MTCPDGCGATLRPRQRYASQACKLRAKARERAERAAQAEIDRVDRARKLTRRQLADAEARIAALRVELQHLDAEAERLERERNGQLTLAILA